MRISRLTISNFRSIKQVQISMGQYCAFVGPNNAGKSNILEALRRTLGASYLSASSFDIDDVHLRQDGQNIYVGCEFDVSIEYKELNNATPVQIKSIDYNWTTYVKGEKKGHPKLELRCLDANNNIPNIQKTYGGNGKRPEFKPLIGIPSEIRDHIPLIHIGTNRQLRDQLPEYAKARGLDFDNLGISVIEVGGKSNLPDYIDISLSFGIRVSVLFDRDSHSFKDKRDQEKALNSQIDNYASELCLVVSSEPDFEQELKKVIGDTIYNQKCSQFAVSKALRGRLFAIEFPDKLPESIEKILAPMVSAASITKNKQEAAA